MAKFKPSKKFIRISAAVVVCFIILIFMLNGINPVPFKYRNTPVSFLTPDLTWDCKPSDVILKYGLPKDIGEVSDITGERDFNFNFVYDEKDVSLSADNRGALNSTFHRYYFTIECKTPEQANKYFDECHKKIMDLHKNDPDFEFEGTETETDYQFTDGNTASYTAINENGAEKILIMDDDGNEIPLEEADNVIQIKTKVNNYDMLNTVGVLCTLAYSEGDSYVTLHAEIMY